MNTLIKCSKIILSFCAVLIGLAVIIYLSQIPTGITPTDKAALETIYTTSGYPHLIDNKAPAEFTEQIAQIREVQKAVLQISPTLQKIPVNAPREPEDLLKAGHGQCSDRARSILKGLELLGYRARFAAIFSFDQTHMPPEQLARQIDDVRSHALIEVLTAKGWLFVDTNEPWVSLDENGNPVSLQQWQDVSDRTHFKWSASNEGQIYWLMKSSDLMVIYGLYSRHGLFYPPFTPYIPDINWRELVQTRLI
ncbi:MAG: transglutaminase domain-containing protein [Pseudobdellovibrionaceae bacterium]